MYVSSLKNPKKGVRIEAHLGGPLQLRHGIAFVNVLSKTEHYSSMTSTITSFSKL